MQSAIQTAREIDQQSKQTGFNQEALDQMARQGFANAKFEVNGEEGMDLVEEFYREENQETYVEQVQSEAMARTNGKSKPRQGDRFVQDIQDGLQRNVRAVN